MEQIEIEQQIKDVLTAKGIPQFKIEEYLDDIFNFADINDYKGITDEAIRLDYDDWTAE